MTTYYTTSEAAKLLSVSPDTVLKWVRAGKIPSYRTPGGHCRISGEVVAGLLSGKGTGAQLIKSKAEAPGYSYCWQFYSGPDGIRDECRSCVAYRSQARRCYEMREIPEEFGHLKLFCETSCDACEFYHLTRSEGRSALIVSRNRRWLSDLEAQAPASSLKIGIASGEYECAAVIERLRPDFVVLDCALGRSRTNSICKSLSRDERIPFVRIILTSPESAWAAECAEEIFGWIQKPFGLKQLQEFIDGAAGGESQAGSLA